MKSSGIIAYLTFALVGCDNLSGGKDIQPKLTSQATLERVVLHVKWLTDDQMARDHPGKRGVTNILKLEDGYHAYVEVVQPKDFNDFNRTETLGHECWHALGAKHEP